MQLSPSQLKSILDVLKVLIALHFGWMVVHSLEVTVSRKLNIPHIAKACKSLMERVAFEFWGNLRRSEWDGLRPLTQNMLVVSGRVANPPSSPMVIATPISECTCEAMGDDLPPVHALPQFFFNPSINQALACHLFW